MDLGGAPRAAAVRLIERLTRFGQDEPGQETLGLLINRLLAYSGGGPDADFLRGLFASYPLKSTPVATHPLPPWRGHERPAEVQEKIFKNMSKRAAEMLRDDLEAAAPARLSDVEAAQKEILSVTRRLADAGEIMLGGGGDDFV